MVAEILHELGWCVSYRKWYWQIAILLGIFHCFQVCIVSGLRLLRFGQIYNPMRQVDACFWVPDGLYCAEDCVRYLKRLRILHTNVLGGEDDHAPCDEL